MWVFILIFIKYMFIWHARHIYCLNYILNIWSLFSPPKWRIWWWATRAWSSSPVTHLFSRGTWGSGELRLCDLTGATDSHCTSLVVTLFLILQPYPSLYFQFITDWVPAFDCWDFCIVYYCHTIPSPSTITPSLISFSSILFVSTCLLHFLLLQHQLQSVPLLLLILLHLLLLFWQDQHNQHLMHHHHLLFQCHLLFIHMIIMYMQL